MGANGDAVEQAAGEAIQANEAAAAAAKAPKEKAPPKRGIGTVANEALKAGKTNAEVLAAIKAEFPEANTSMASVNWYRNNLRTSGEDVPTARSLAQADREAAKVKRDAEKAATKAAAKETRDAAKAAKAAEKAAATAAAAAAAAAAADAASAPAAEGEGIFA